MYKFRRCFGRKNFSDQLKNIVRFKRTGYNINVMRHFHIFDTFGRGFSTADKLFALGQLLKVVRGDKEFSNVHSNQDFPRTGVHSWVGIIPQSVWSSGLKEVSSRGC